MSEAVQNPQSSGSPAKGIETMSTEVTIEKLPLDLLLRVMEFVPMAQWPSLESVSKTFQNTMHQMWRTVRKINVRRDLAIAESVDSETINLLLKKLADHAPNIYDIGGFKSCPLNGDSIDLLVRFEKLERVELYGFNELEKFLKKSASRKVLKEVKAVILMGQGTPGEQSLCEAFSYPFSVQNGLAPLKLESLSFDHNPCISCAFLDVVDVSKLTSFNVIYTHVGRSLMVRFLNRAIKLERLEFSFDCLDDEQQDGVPHVHAAAPGPTQSLLELNKKIIREVGNLKNLVSLTMGTSYAYTRHGCGCRNLDDEMVRMLERLGGGGSMKELSLWQVDSDTSSLANCVATALTNLSSLEMNVARCAGAPLERMLMVQKSLVSLKLWDINYYCDRDGVILHTMANEHSLKVLDLRCGTGVIPKEELLQICAFTQLKELRVSSGYAPENAPVFDDAVLVAWAEAFGSTLETLEIFPPLGDSISDRGFLPSIKKMRRLRKLHISGSKITDRSLKEMAAGCRDIRDLNVAYSCNITIEGVQAMIDGCEYLQVLDVRRTCLRSPGALKIPKYRKISILR